MRKTREEKMMVKVLAEGEFTPGDINIIRGESNRLINEAVESEIDDVWEKKLKIAKVLGKRIYNGVLYRLNDITVGGGYFTVRN